MDIKDNENVNWDAVREEYLAGGIGQRRLAQKWGVSYGALRRRAEAGGWVGMKKGSGVAGSEEQDLIRHGAVRRATFPRGEGLGETGVAGSAGKTSSDLADGGKPPARPPSPAGKAFGEREVAAEATSSVSACGAATFPTPPPAAQAPPLLRGGETGKAFGESAPAGDADIALRLRRKLLRRLERMADEIPDGAVTEYKTQDDSAVKLFKLRDLTAAYKEIAGDLAPEAGEQDGVKVVVDV